MEIHLSDHFTYKKLLRFTFPSVIMMVFTSLYGVVDGFFVTNYAGKTALAAINFVYPVLNILAIFGYMIGTGGSALVAKTLGEGKAKKANSLFSLFVYMSIILSVAFSVIGFFTLGPLMKLLGAEGEMLKGTLIYGNILLISLTFWNLQFLFQIFFITAEKPKLGLYVTLAAGFANMLLDWLLVGILDFGIAGAAAATAISQFIGGGLPLIYFFTKNNSLLHLKNTSMDVRALIKAFTNGSSEFISGISGALVGILYNIQLMKYAGEDGVAAYSIMMYVCFVFIGIFFGYANGSAPIVGFHYGAENHKELHNMLKKGLILNFTAASVMLILSEALSKVLAKMFAGYDPVLYDMTLNGFRIYAVSFFFSGFAILGPSFFTSLNNGLISGILSFMRTVVFQVLFVFLLPEFFGIDGIWYSVVLAEALSAFLSVLFFIIMRKKYHY